MVHKKGTLGNLERNVRCPTCERLVPDRLLTISTVCKRLAVSRATVYRLLAEAELVGLKVRGAMRIPESSVESYLRRAMARYIAQNS